MNLNEEPRLKKDYHIPLPLFEKAFRNFQKKYVYPRNIVLTLLLLAIGGVYIKAAVDDPSSKLSVLLTVICIGMVLILWYNPLKLRRSLMNSLKELENDIYHFSLYDEGVTIQLEDAPQENAETETPENETEEAPLEADVISEKDDFGEFEPIFDESAAKSEAAEKIPPTQLPFGEGLKILEYDDYFMLYLVKQNFYVVPKSDFTEMENELLRASFFANQL